jgi:hypothetical protein
LQQSLLPFCEALAEEGLIPSISAAVHMGDFNFTPVPAVDRLFPPPATMASDQHSAQLWAAAAPGLRDALRVLRPNKTVFTFQRGESFARLDAVHVPTPLAPFLSDVRVLGKPIGSHRGFAVSIRPRSVLKAVGAGRAPVPKALPKTPEAAAGIRAFAEEAVAFGMLLLPGQLLEWFPVLTKQLAKRCSSLAKQASAARSLAARDLQEKEAELVAAEEAFVRGEVAGAEQQAGRAARLGALSAALAARRETQQAVVAPMEASARMAFIDGGERPSPHLTAALHPPRAASTFTAIRDGAGQVVNDLQQIPEVMVEHFAGISKARVTDPVARDAVLGALTADVQEGGSAKRITAAAAEAAGDPVVTEEEVKAALLAAPRGSAAGPDRIPYTIWGVGGGGVWASLLARFFTAIGTLQILPADFNLGSLTPLRKPDQEDLLSASSLRPITLLDALYRLLARILAARLAKALGPAIGEEQCGYLPGRWIGDAILLGQLLPQLLAAEGIEGVMVALDIAKAFDTVDRDFLERALSVLGAGEGLVMWVHLLLSDTRASVHVNGYESSQRVWHAGVRQGCPLSPLLYLVIGQVLASWLRSRPELGLVVDGRRYVSSHLADDTKVFAARTQAAQQGLADALATFAAATGQAINLAKSKAVSIGAHLSLPSQMAGGPFAGVPQVHSMVSLGVPLYHQPSLPLPLHAHAHETRGAGRLPRDAGAPPHAASASAMSLRLVRATGKLEKIRKLPLSAMGKGLASSSYAVSQLLYFGEFEGLPSQSALKELGACMAASVGPGVGLPLLVGKPKEGGFGCLPVEEHLMARHGAMALRLLRSLLPSRLPMPPWAAVAAGLLLRACPDLHPAQTLLLATESSREDVGGGILVPRGVGQAAHVPAGPLRRMAAALQRVGPLSLPADASPLDPSVRQILTAAPEFAPGATSLPLEQLQWSQLNGALVGEVIPVRDITSALTADLTRQRQCKHAAYAAEAVGGTMAATQAEALGLRRTFKRVWRSSVDNRLKEVLLRVAGHAIPGCRVPAWACPCAPGVVVGAANSRVHTFWTCPVAVAVRAELERVLQQPVLRPDVWLLQPPAAGVRPEVWDLVCLAALGAMEHGRKLGWALQAEHQQPLQQPAIAAVVRFWEILDSCISPSLARDLESAPLGPVHPFLCLSEGRLAVRGQPQL